MSDLCIRIFGFAMLTLLAASCELQQPSEPAMMDSVIMSEAEGQSLAEAEFTAFRYTSPGAREILVPDTATMDEVLEVLRSNNVPADGPHEILVDDRKGGQFVGGYKIKVALITYNPGESTIRTALISRRPPYIMERTVGWSVTLLGF